MFSLSNEKLVSSQNHFLDIELMAISRQHMEAP